MRQLVSLARTFVGRVLALGLLTLAAMLPLAGLSFLLGRSPKQSRSPHRIVWGCISVALDFAFTFVTPALALTTRSVRGTLRIGGSMLRRTWPRSALYDLFPPLALRVNSLAYPANLPMLELIAAAGLTVVGLLAKDATVAFYLREILVNHQDGAARL